MMNQSTLIKFLLFSFLLISLNSCKSFKAITEIPKNYVSKPAWGNDESEIKFKVVQPLNKLYDELKKFESTEYKDESSESFKTEDIPLIAKTKNPAYNPTKWIKTRNPLYNKKKWLKACFLGKCVKTKNPAYNPTKWIKTKNPAYSPNKWMSVTTSIPTVQGYKLKARVDGKVKFTTYEGNNFHFKVPIKTSGWITLITAIPGVPSLVRTPFDGKLNIEVDVSVDINENWCITVNPNSKFKWLKRLELDYSYGLGVLEVDVTKLANPQIEKMLKDLEKDIQKSIDCQKIKNDVSKQWRTRIFDIDESFKAVAIPKGLGLSQLQATKDEITIFGSIKTKVKITDDVTNIEQEGELPNLVIIQPENPKINLSLPIEIPYSYIEKEIENKFDKFRIGNEDSFLNGNVIVKSVKLFPSGKSLGIKVKFKTKTNLGLTNVKAIAYFTGELSHIKSTEHFISFKLKNLAFNDFGSGKDKVVLSLGYNAIKKSIEEMDNINITQEIKETEALLLKTLKELTIYLPQDIKSKNKNIDLEETQIKIGNWAFSRKYLKLLLKGKASIK